MLLSQIPFHFEFFGSTNVSSFQVDLVCSQVCKRFERDVHFCKCMICIRNKFGKGFVEGEVQGALAGKTDLLSLWNQNGCSKRFKVGKGTSAQVSTLTNRAQVSTRIRKFTSG